VSDSDSGESDIGGDNDHWSMVFKLYYNKQVMGPHLETNAAWNTLIWVLRGCTYKRLAVTMMVLAALETQAYHHCGFLHFSLLCVLMLF
jgi:hypothetical protein